MEAAMMIPDSGNRTFTIKLENSDQQPPFKWFTTDVVGWLPIHSFANPTRYAPMVWNPWTLTAMPVGDWISGTQVKHSDDTDAAWSVTYRGLDTMPHHPEVQT
jgi:hypothetical protein